MFEVAVYVILCFILSISVDLVYVKIISKDGSVNPSRLAPSFIAYGNVDKFGRALSGGGRGPYRTLLFLILASYIASLTVNSIAALGGEVGWRAFLFINLYRHLGLTNAIALTGLVWGLWHVPMVLLVRYDSAFYEPKVNSLSYIAFCLVLSVPSSILLLKASSLLPVLSLHGSVNSIWRMTEAITKINQQHKVKILLSSTIMALTSWCITVTLFTIFLNYIR